MATHLKRRIIAYLASIGKPISPNLPMRTLRAAAARALNVTSNRNVLNNTLPTLDMMPAPTFYATEEWRRVRYQVLKLHGGCCQCCGARGGRGSPLHVDHIRPRSIYPELELEITNLQVLCADCNIGKGAWDQTDWRPSRGKEQ
jgi:5-methylcytosine-specific restriction endonuclease McrA